MKTFKNKKVKKFIVLLLALVNIATLNLSNITYSYAANQVHGQHVFNGWIDGGRLTHGSHYINGIEFRMTQGTYNSFSAYELIINDGQPAIHPKYPFVNGVVRMNFLEYNGGFGIVFGSNIKIRAINLDGSKTLVYAGPAGDVSLNDLQYGQHMFNGWVDGGRLTHGSHYINGIDFRMAQGTYDSLSAYELIINDGQPVIHPKYPIVDGVVRMNFLEYNGGYGLIFGSNIKIQAINLDGAKTLVYAGPAGNDSLNNIAQYGQHMFNRWVEGRWIDGAYGVDAIEFRMTQGTYDSFSHYELIINQARPIIHSKPPIVDGVVRMNFLEYNGGLGLVSGLNIKIHTINLDGTRTFVYDGPAGAVTFDGYAINSWVRGSNSNYVDELYLSVSRAKYDSVVSYAISIDGGTPVTYAKLPYIAVRLVKINLLEYNRGHGIHIGRHIEIWSIDAQGKYTTVYKGKAGHNGPILPEL